MRARLAILMFVIAGTALCLTQPDKAEPGMASEPAHKHGQLKPLTRQLVEKLVAAGTDSGQLAMAIDGQGIDFKPTADDLAALRKAGAKEVLIEALERASPPRDDITVPKRIFGSEPPYTESARRRNVQGTVELFIVIGTEGNVNDAVVVRPLDPTLDDSAVQTIRTWRFRPATRNGLPVYVCVSVEVSFNLYLHPTGF